MEHRLDSNQSTCFEVIASQPYSNNYLKVKPGELYEFEVDARDTWTDWFIKTNANGFCNFFLRDKDKRVPGHKCFKLCGTIGKNEADHFPIGTNKLWQSTSDDEIYFFANDSKKLNKKKTFKFYQNNKGSISLTIRRHQ
ncbi:hypothetical protein [Seonamhaeicola sp.]|uniref:hypothetical protein n=1 Tax=Seonamhaeicola sp. TaxID=1912245 RepID=UPI002619FED7|nr:hypothetical protein [Seonamhaeicola sp.]